MKIPESVRIAGIEYKVVIVPNLNTGVNMAYGHIDYDNYVIELSDTHGTEHQKRCTILWHEILHGIRENNGMEIENEEAIVDMFAKGIYQVLQDNGARLFDLATPVPTKPSIDLRCTTCKYFAGCEMACGGNVCDIYEELDGGNI